MTDETKNNWISLAKFGAIGVVIITGIISAMVFFNSLSCVSVPKPIEGDTIDCQRAVNLAVLCIQAKQQCNQGETSMAMRYCLADRRYDKCKAERKKYIEDNQKLIEQNAVTSVTLDTMANNTYLTCVKDLTPG